MSNSTVFSAAMDHDHVRLLRSDVMNVIGILNLARDRTEKPVPTFPDHALTDAGRAIISQSIGKWPAIACVMALALASSGPAFAVYKKVAIKKKVEYGHNR